MLSEAIHRLFVLIPVVAAAIVVSVLFLDHLALLIVEELDGGVHRAQPGVLVDFADGDAAFRVDLEQAPEQVSRLHRDVLLQQVLALENQLVQLVHRLRLERHRAVEHGKQDDASAPQVHIQTVAAVTQDFGRYVGRCTTLLSHDLIRLDLPGHAEVRYLDVTLAIQQYIVELNVPMRDILRVNIAQTVDNLTENLLREGLLEPPSFTHVVKQIATGAKLHYNDYVLLSFDSLIDLDYVIVAQFEQQVDLLHQFSLLHFVGEGLLVERLERDQFPHELVHGKVDFAESATAQHLPNPVERDIGDRRLLGQLEGSLNFLHDVADLLGARAELVEL